MQFFFDHIKNHHPVSDAAQQALMHHFKKHISAKGELLLKEGQICRHMYFLEKGAIRGYYNIEGKEITHWFGFEHDFVTSFHSFISGEPAVENIQLLETSNVLAISKSALFALFDAHHEIERLVRIIYEKYYMRLEERYVNAQFKTAGERYAEMLQHTPHIVERVPLGYIASYLGISQETLSRVRSRL